MLLHFTKVTINGKMSAPWPIVFEDLNNEHADLSLSHCLQWKAISRSSSHYNSTDLRALSWQTSTATMLSVSLLVSWPRCLPFQEHCLIKTFSLTQKALSSGRPKQWICTLPQCHQNPPSHFKTILQENYCINFKSFLLGDLNYDLQSLLPSVIHEWPLEGPLLGITLLTRKSSVSADLKSKHTVSSWVDMRQSCQYICLIWM